MAEIKRYLDEEGLAYLWERILAQIQVDIAVLEKLSNKVTSITSASTHTEYPSARAVYELLQSGGVIEPTSSLGDGKFIPNGTIVDVDISGIGFSKTTNLLTTNDYNISLRANSSNPFLGLRVGNNKWYAQASGDYFYFGQTTSNALRIDQTGNGNFQNGSVTALSFIMSGGTSSQFLKADGSVDSNVYITSAGQTQLSKGTTTGNGNAVTDINVSNHQITLVKGQTFLTSQDISNKADKSEAIGSLTLTLDSSNYRITLSGTKVNGDSFTVSDVIDLPIESVVVGGRYDDATKKVILTLQNGNTIEFSVADLVAGLQSEITPTNKLSADLISGGTINKVVTQTEKDTWNAKYDKPSGGIPASDLDSGVNSSLSKADTAYQKPSSGIPLSDLSSEVIEDIDGKLDRLSSSTDNAVVRFDGTQGDIQNSNVIVDDNGGVTLNTLIVQGTNTSNSTRRISSSGANEIHLQIGTALPLVVTDSAVRPGIDHNATINLGSTSTYWKNVYGSKFITNGGTSSQFLKGDGTLDSNIYIKNGDVLQTTNPFAPQPSKLYISKIDNAFNAADKRFTVTAEFVDGNTTTTVEPSRLTQLFNGSYEGGLAIDGGASGNKKLVIHIRFDGYTDDAFPSYPYGDIFLSFYYTACPSSVSGRCYCNYEPHGIGWHDLTVTNLSSGSSSILYKIRNSYYKIQEFEFTIVSDTTNSYGYTTLTEIEMKLDRPDPSLEPVLNKYSPQTLYYNLTAPAFIKTGGTSSQFLKADGSVDSNVYITSAGQTQLSKGATTGNGNAVTDLTVSGHTITLQKNKTFEETTNKTTSITSSSTNEQYPSALAVYNAISSVTVTAITNEEIDTIWSNA